MQGSKLQGHTQHCLCGTAILNPHAHDPMSHPQTDYFLPSCVFLPSAPPPTYPALPLRLHGPLLLAGSAEGLLGTCTYGPMQNDA